jgi:hypothetical protein
MSTPPNQDHDAFAERAQTLRRHLAPLYRLARLLTGDDEAAISRVMAVGRRGLQQSESLSRAQLFRMLLETRAGDDEAAESDGPALAALHQRFAHDHLRRALPSAFLALPKRQQLLLLLVAAERFSPADAGRILDLTPERARAERKSAYNALRKRLLRSAPNDERNLLAPHLSDEALGRALAEHLTDEPTSTPASLHQAVTDLIAERKTPDATPEERSAAPAASDDDSAGEARSSSRRTSRLLTMLLLIVMTGTVGLLAARFLQDDDAGGPRRDLVAYSAQQAPTVEPNLRTQDASRAERFIREEVGRRLAAPTIDSARLAGVGLRSMAEARVPVLLYENEGGGTLPVYVYTYAVLDRLGEQYDFSDDALARIERDGGYAARQAQGRGVLIWRDRDDIFLAVTEGEAASLRRRVAAEGAGRK